MYYTLFVILREVRLATRWQQEAQMPSIEGFDNFEMKHILAAAAMLEFPTNGRRKPFSRKNMAMWMGRDRFETLRDGLARLGYIKIAKKRGRNRWTAKGRDLLMQVKAGRFGPIVSVMNTPPQIRQEELAGDEIRLWTVEVK
jgi:hypothetical protein